MDRKMEPVRNYVQNNRSSIVNIVYIVAAVVLVYYLVMYYLSVPAESDVVVLKNKVSAADATEVVQKDGKHIVAEVNAKKGRVKSTYAVSTWFYINSFSQTTNAYQNILAFLDGANTTGSALLTIGLHGTKPQLIVRAGKVGTANTSGVFASDSDFVKYTNNVFNFNTVALPTDAQEQCDVMDIDMQRWMNVTVCVNGRIMDVFLDGKLARSCILPALQDISQNGQQIIAMCASNAKFSGYVSGVTVSNYVLTPDVIYGRYQAGPYASTGFLDYLVDKIGIKIQFGESK